MQSLEKRNLVVVDIETTGVNPFRHDALAVAFVPMDERLPEQEIFISHEQLQWNAFAQRNFERFKEEWNAHAVPAPLACSRIEDYIGQTFRGEEVTLIGHNVGFDIAFLRKIAYQGGRDQIAGISHRAVDTHTLLYLLALEDVIPPGARTSDGAFKHFGIEVVAEKRHSALHDARATRILFRCLLENLSRKSGDL